jgi:hypothetical protein
MPHSI